MSNSIEQALRKTCLDIRKALSIDMQHHLSNKICNRIRSLNQYRHAKRIALYHATNGEVDLGSIWRSAPLHGKYCYFPVMSHEHSLLFLPATPATAFSRNQFGILEPETDSEHAIAPNELDLIIAPLVAFDPYGTRLGMGKGYYDQTLATLKPHLLLGVAYEFQLHPYIAPKPWDVRLDAVVTEKNIYWSPK